MTASRARPRAATLAVGTEVTDGHVLDRNSAWLSRQFTRHGIDTIEHRAVPDERSAIRSALLDLSARAEILFVTGGLGPTTDDFTREVIAEVFERPLVFDDSSWARISERLSARGVPVRESQRQQCLFPYGAEILPNSAGTANGFTFRHGRCDVYVLPGPPLEVSAVWEAGVEGRLQGLTAEIDRERLLIFRCIGKGEAEFADMTERILGGSGLRLGYRVHVPYVEVKVWVPNRDRDRHAVQIAALETELGPWLVNRDDEDLVDDIFALLGGGQLAVFDRGTHGLLAERLSSRWRETNRAGESFSLLISQEFTHPDDIDVWFSDVFSGASAAHVLALAPDKAGGNWRVAARSHGVIREEVVMPPFRQPLLSERSRKFIVERSLQILRDLW